MTRYYGAVREKFNEEDYIKVYQPINKSEEIATMNFNSPQQQKSLKDYVPEVYDQGQMNSCTANAICALLAVNQNKKMDANGSHDLRSDPSRLFLYYNTRRMADSGATFQEVMEAFDASGICEETLWPYQKEKLTITPDMSAYNNAKGIITQRQRLIQDVQTFKNCLDNGYPFVFGFTVYNRCFDDAGETGVLPLPTKEERPLPDGYHAVMAVEYDDDKNVFLILNSYGRAWGKDGYFYMPYQFITDAEMCFDFWTITFDLECSRKLDQDGSRQQNQDGNQQSANEKTWLPYVVVVTTATLIFGTNLYKMLK